MYLAKNNLNNPWKILQYFRKNHTPCHLIIFEKLVGLRDLTAERENFQTILLFLYFFRWGISLFRVFSPHTSVFYRPTVIKKRGKDFPKDIFSYWCLITRRNSVRPRKVWFRNFIIYATFGFFFLFSFFSFYLFSRNSATVNDVKFSVGEWTWGSFSCQSLNESMRFY